MTATAKPAPVFVVLDLETNDADFTKPIQLLEVAAIAVDPATLTPYASLDFPVLPADLSGAFRSAPGVVKEMHRSNGLWEALFQGLVDDDGIPDVAAADEHLSEFFYAIGATERSVVLCGFSVGTFDHRVISQLLPRSAKYLSHRTIDIGAIARDLALAGVEVKPAESTANHRAMPDCQIELEVWRNCRAAVRRVLT